MMFEANANTSAGYNFNPMTGHAAGSEIKPYSISITILIAY